MISPCWRWLLGACLCLCGSLIGGAAELAGKAERPAVTENAWVILASGGCEGCEWLKDTWFPTLKEQNPAPLPPLLFIDLDKEGGYEALMEIEKRLELKDKGDKFPSVLIGSQMIYGEEALEKATKAVSAEGRKAVLHFGVRDFLIKNSSLPLELFELGNGGKAVKPTKPKPKPTPSTTPSDLAGYRQAGVIYFESPGCSGCDRAEKQLRYFHRKYPEIAVFKVNALEPKGRILQMAVATRLNLPKAKSLLTPMFASGTAAYAKDEATDDNLATLFANVPNTPFWQDWDEATELAQAETALKTMSKEMTVGLVLAGGLIDGINPCAFAVVVFLISCLGLGGGQGKRYALVFGGLFCAGVFCCYLLLGMGLTGLLEHLQGVKGAFRILTYGMAVLCLVFAIACFRDAWQARKHGASAMEFGIPKPVTKIIHRLIRNNVGRSLLSLSAFGLGMLVSALELVCTGQVYLPVLAFINAADPGGRSIGLLLAYNVAFILPLVAVTLIGTFGAGATPLVHWGRKHAASTKAATGLVILGIGVALALLG